MKRPLLLSVSLDDDVQCAKLKICCWNRSVHQLTGFLFVCLSLSNWSIKHFGGNCSPKFGRAGMKWRICVCVCVRVLKVDPRQGGWERHHLCCFSLTVESGRVLFKYANVFFSKKGYCGCKYHCGYFSITLMMKRNNNKFESRPSWSSNVI